MENNKILQSDVLDIIFEKKNKMYGAYELRKNYHKRARKSLVIVSTLMLVITSIPLLAGLLDKDDARTARVLKPTVICTLPTPPTPPTPRVNEQPEPPVTNTVKHTNPEITPAEEVTPEDELPTNDKLKDAVSSTTSTDGTPSTETLLPPADGKETGTPPIVEQPAEKEKIYGTEEINQNPEFPGGEEAMMAFLSNKLIYPKAALDANITGKLMVSFVVDKEGNISDLDFVKKAGYGFDEEASRVVKLMPKWTPGKVNGKPVNVRFEMPISFEVED